jgi:hypothetical protein
MFIPIGVFVSNHKIESNTIGIKFDYLLHLKQARINSLHPQSFPNTEDPFQGNGQLFTKCMKQIYIRFN